MTREEQINEAVNTYMNGLFEDGIEIPIEDFENIEEGFIVGAKWADAHPKSPWISVEEDLPCNHKELIENEYNTKKVLVVLEWEDSPIEKFIAIRDMYNIIGSYNVGWYWRNIVHYHVILWASLPELPKE